MTEANPFQGIPEIVKYWDHLTSTAPGWWKMPDELIWICGKWAYSRLPPTWTGSCSIRIVQLGTILLPNSQGEQVGVPLFETLETGMKKSLSVGRNQRWREDEWPPQRINETYGLATWAQDGSWGYWAAIYVLNQIIRL
jgi:hypothetical protein